VASISGFGPRVQESIDAVLEMLRQCNYDKACILLHRLNRDYVEEWSYVKDELLKRVDSSELPTFATILECSTKKDLSVCNPLIPGLSRYTQD
jgi:hypothetical protein